MTDQRCVICGTPMVDHVPVRYAVKTAVRHRMIVWAGAILGRLPMGKEDMSW